MTSFYIENTKNFMAGLLKSDMFDSFEVRSFIATTFTTFEIHCDYNKDFFTDVIEEEREKRKICLWKDIKHYAFDIIKGNKLPKSIKVVFSANDELRKSVYENSSAMFMNVIFDDGELKVITGFSTKEFTLDKSGEYEWDSYVENFLKNNNIIIRK
ncbi:MAG: hypothetical protein IAC55_04850 [Tyzzerella sp.]|uniref:Uncharacterized protein n=1 Tax=Candidatus Fimicola merdigallinarum TaxID=2840819 RepID=A0A9D9DVA6_9FIRM|nr:hypothetical protein [Candidatus Fimicola merdigallinarum]